MDGEAIEATLDLDDSAVVPEWANRIARVVLFPFYLLAIAVEKVSGEAKWQRKQYRTMVDERPPMSNDEFLTTIDADTDPRVVLAVRYAFSQSTGVPAESIYPSDLIAEVGRLQLVGPDLLDIVFRTERIAKGPKLTVALAEVRPNTVGEFAVLMADQSKSALS